MNLSDIITEYAGGRPVEFRRQCGIPLDETTICPQEAIGEVTIPLEDGTAIDMPICEGHLEALAGMRRDLTTAS